MNLSALEDVLWALLALFVLVPLLVGYRVWDLRASERLIRRWADANGLTILLLQRRRFWVRKPPMVSAGTGRRTTSSPATRRVKRSTVGSVSGRPP